MTNLLMNTPMAEKIFGIEKMKNGWMAFPQTALITVEEFYKIIDEALCYGFEFKFENNMLWYR